ncbi:hypothetical protein IFM61606_06169 [Aspergillus udagawae]|uniref:Yeast cell wall synthesis Kre9/Knh1-like N-terminal domain-containing protein n=1 Tax=Aspergillus udagawae TaxID=91492 RepID=A0A8E0QYC3_9EURO|nr:uncharacterized protein Aud_009191 [Aspergillus udagawae]GFG04817.1 hypothetical protein IFM5058_02115 [Aspergillus udagawae]GFG26198.1 hypothetical protein IFM61606_06169 [Aspergillus udagawae]GIC92720.1 hypothetical protein Aud_009191 [Aspergillus udagawae]
MFCSRTFLATWACLAQLGAAQMLAFTTWPTHIYQGKPATVTWLGAPDVPATIYLRKGDANNLDHVQVLTTDAKGGSFTFVPDDSLPDGSDYALQIQQGAEENYSGLITLGNPGSKPPSPPMPPSPSKLPKPTEDAKPQNISTPTPQDDASSHHGTDTSPGDDWETEVAKGNNAQFTNVEDMSKGSNSNFTHGKSAMAAKLETSGASIENVYLGWVLATVGVLFYVAE